MTPVPKQPNLLFIVSDQQRSDTMECYGASHVNSKALNSLASRSFVFENSYVSQPVCTPSRATMLTGLYPHTAGMMKNNIVLDPAIKSIAEMVDDSTIARITASGIWGTKRLLNTGSTNGFRWQSCRGLSIIRIRLTTSSFLRTGSSPIE